MDSRKAWKLRNPEKEKEWKRRNYQQTQFGNNNSYNSYDQDHDWLILNSPFTDRELHTIIGRSVQAIQIRRCRLKQGLVSTGGLRGLK